MPMTTAVSAKMSKKFTIQALVEIPVEFADETKTLEDAYDSVNDYLANDLDLIVLDMMGVDDSLDVEYEDLSDEYIPIFLRKQAE